MPGREQLPLAAPQSNSQQLQVVLRPAAVEAAEAAGAAADARQAGQAPSQDAEVAASPASYDGPRDLESFLPAALAAVFHE